MIIRFQFGESQTARKSVIIMQKSVITDGDYRQKSVISAKICNLSATFVITVQKSVISMQKSVITVQKSVITVQKSIITV